MNRLHLSLLIILSFAMLGAGCVRVRRPVVRAPAAQMERAPSDGTVLAIVALNGGAAEIKRGEETDAVKDGLEVMGGDALSITSGTVALIYPDAGASYIEEGGSVVILPDGEGTGSVFAQIEIIVGSIWTRFERLLGSDERFSVSGNGVVATVRGTAFGAEKTDSGLDVQVANDEVDVAPLEVRRNPALAAKVVRLKAGEGLRVTADNFRQLDATRLRRVVRALSTMEKRRRSFERVSRTLPPNILRPQFPRLRLNRSPVIPEIYRERIDPKMLERFMLLPVVFTAPLRAVIRAEFAPTSTPTVSGP